VVNAPSRKKKKALKKKLRSEKLIGKGDDHLDVAVIPVKSEIMTRIDES
jgi:hypothetical protein